MAVWFVFAVPIVVMVFALFMERVETRLRPGAVREDEVEAFLDNPQPRRGPCALRARHRPRAGAVPAASPARHEARARKVMNAPTIRISSCRRHSTDVTLIRPLDIPVVRPAR